MGRKLILLLPKRYNVSEVVPRQPLLSSCAVLEVA